MLALFPYMDSFFGKGVFIIFIGLLMIGFDKIGSLSGVVGIVLLTCGCAFIVLKLMGLEKDREGNAGSKNASNSGSNNKKENMATKASKNAAKKELKRRTGN